MTVNAKICIAAIAGLGIGFLISYSVLHEAVNDQGELKFKMSGTVPTEDAIINIESYQNNLAYARLSLNSNKYKVKGILHDTTAIKNYYDTVFMDFKKTHTARSGFHWEVALYPNICLDPKTKKNRLNIYFIPTMVSDDSARRILEFYSAITGKDSVSYKPSDTTKIKWLADKPYIFDQGTLFP